MNKKREVFKSCAIPTLFTLSVTTASVAARVQPLARRAHSQAC